MNISSISSADTVTVFNTGHEKWNAQAKELFWAAVPGLHYVALENVADKARWLNDKCLELDYWLSYTPASCPKEGKAFLHGKDCTVHVNWHTFTGETARTFVVFVENPGFEVLFRINRGRARDILFIVDGRKLHGSLVVDGLFKGEVSA